MANSRKNRVNPKHYIGKFGKSGVTWALAFALTSGGIAYLADELTDADLDTSTNEITVQKFEERLSQLKTLKSDIGFIDNVYDEQNISVDDFSLREQKFLKDAHKFLADVMINEDDTILSEKDRMYLMNKFNSEVDSLKNYGFTPLDEDTAARLDGYYVKKSALQDDFSKVVAAQELNNMVNVEETGMWLLIYALMMLPTVTVFPSLRSWKDNKKLNDWSKEPPKKPKPPRFKH